MGRPSASAAAASHELGDLMSHSTQPPPWESNTTGSAPAASAGRLIRMLTWPVGPPRITRSSMSAGWSWTQALAWICRSAWRASLGDRSYRGGLPAAAAATLRSHCSVCGSITGVKAAGRLAVVEVTVVLP
jgi:hypothetical protein